VYKKVGKRVEGERQNWLESFSVKYKSKEGEKKGE